jgi:PAS domain S-box-containing protein
MRTDELWVSEQSRAMLGTCCGEKISLRQFLDDVHPDDRRALEGAMRQSLHGGGGFEREYRRLRPDGRIGWVAVFGRVEYGQDGRPVRARGVSLDITQRMEAELAAQQHRDELARLNRVHLLGVLSASLSHELNQPLTAILSNAQAAQRFLAGPAPDLTEVQSILHDISEDDRRAADIIRRLRGVLQQGEVARQPLDVNVIIHEVLRLLRADLWHRQIVIQTSLAAELPPIQGDRVQLQQVLINLILNGCDAMADNQPGRRTLRISTGWAEDRRVKICFADQGQGVLPEQREVIFQPFFTTKAQGMGLGLAVCRAIVTAHRGEVWAEGEPDGGALLCVSLPVHLESRV